MHKTGVCIALALGNDPERGIGVGFAVHQLTDLEARRRFVHDAYARAIQIVEMKTRLCEFAPESIQHVRYEFTRVGRTDADFSLTAIHGIDMARFLARSDYARIRFNYREFPELGPTTANIMIEGSFESGATVQVEFLPVSGVSYERAAVHVHDHSFYLSLPAANEPGGLGALRHFHKDKLVAEITSTQAAGSDDYFIACGFFGENAEFLDSVRDNRRPSGDLATARQSVEIMEFVRERQTQYTKKRGPAR